MTYFNLVVVGLGVIGAETLGALLKYKSLKNKKKIKIAIIEKDIKNIPGGVAYSQSKSKFGFFNNPLRLSHPEFIYWIKKSKNINKLIKFIIENRDFNLNNWLKENKKKFKSSKKISEVYFPRLVYSFYLEEKIKKFLKDRNKIKVECEFFEGEVDNITLKKNIIKPKYKFIKFFLNFDGDKILKKYTKFSANYIKFKNLIFSNGILPPDKIDVKNINYNDNYIWDFYAEGGTENLLKKINKINKKNIKIVFIGNKAGLLETMQSLENLIKKKKVNIHITCISNSTLSLQKAELSKKYQKYKLKFLTIAQAKKNKKSEEILKLLKLEFNNATENYFNKYDVWTKVLKKNILNIYYNNLPLREKKKYHSYIFSQIRNITRYTYPETVKSKENLEKIRKIDFIKDRVVKINKKKNIILINTKKNLNIKCDLIINVSGPMNILNKKNNIKVVKFLKKIAKNYNERGFYSDKNFSIRKNIYIPGTLSYNFNPLRETIIKAITNNTHNVIKNIIRTGSI